MKSSRCTLTLVCTVLAWLLVMTTGEAWATCTVGSKTLTIAPATIYYNPNDTISVNYAVAYNNITSNSSVNAACTTAPTITVTPTPAAQMSGTCSFPIAIPNPSAGLNQSGNCTATFTAPAAPATSYSLDASAAALPASAALSIPNTSVTNVTLYQIPNVQVTANTNGAEATPTAATFRLTLSNAVPQATTVSLAYSGTATNGVDYTGPLTATIPANATTFTLSLPVIDDFVAEGNETITLTLTGVTSGVATLGTTLSRSTTITDNDTKGVVVTGTPATVSEDGTTATPTIALRSQPTGPVTVTLTGLDATEATLSTTTLNFTAANWNLPQPVVITGVDDFIVDGNITFNLRATPTGADYTGVAAATIAVTNTDNDVRGLAISGSPVTVTEAGSTATFTIALKTQPTGNVTVNLTGNDATEATVAPTSMVFTTVNWNVPRTVTVTGVNDLVADGNITFNLTATPTGADYTGVAAQTVSVTTLDDDVAGVTVSPAALTVAEPAGSATFKVHLNSQPTGNVTIALASSDTTESTPSPASLTFTAANWNVDQTVTVNAVDDAIADGSQPSTITLTPSGADYTGVAAPSVSVTTTDNDSKGVTVTIAGGPITVAEPAGSATFSVHLNSQPTGDVTIALASSDTTESTPSPASLTFTAANWNVDQTVTVTAVDDAIADGSQPSTINLTPSGADYAGVTAPSISVTTTDNDTKGVTVTGRPLTVAEPSGSAIFTVHLDSQPTGDVTIALASSDTTESTPSPASLTFTATNWNVDQTVTVNAVDDAIADGSQPSTISLTPSGADYTGVAAPSVSVTTTDDDTKGVTVTGGPLTVAEPAGSATFTVHLDSQPTGDVTIALASSDTTESTPSPASLTFTAANWNVDQTVTVSAVDDAVADGSQPSTISLTPSGADYGGVAAPSVSVTTTDDDTKGVTVTGGPLTVAEPADAATFTVHLNSQPTGDVTIALASSDTTESTPSPASLTFTTANWNVNQTVTVNAVDDLVADGSQPSTISLTPSGADYTGVAAPSVSVTTTDDDAAGLTVSPNAVTVSEAGSTASFTAVLNSQPTGDVTVAISGNDPTEASLSTTTLTFTPANWNVPQPVTVTGVDDAIADGNIVFNLSLTPSGADYGGVAVQSVAVTTTDDDSKGLVVAPKAVTVSEIGTIDSFTVALASQPTGKVTVAITGLDATEAGLATTTLTFTPANWATPQPVAVNGVDDLIADGNQTFTLTLTASGSDYAGVAAETVSVTTLDNDATRLIVTQNNVPLAEGGPAGGFGVLLGSQPIDNVTVTISGNDATEATISATTLTFTPANWNVMQPVTLTPVDDLVVDGNQTFNLTLTPSGADYGGVAAETVVVTVTDNDLAGLTVTPPAITVDEAGATATFSAVLNSQPTGPVTVTITGNDSTEASLSATTLTFTPANWNTPQTVTVTGVDDALDDGDQSFPLTLTPSGADYGAAAPQTVAVTVTDNDTAGMVIAGGPITVSETGTTGTFTVVLTAQPVSPVVVTLTPSDTGEAVVAPATLTFTPANWNVAQTATVTGVDDTAVDGDIASVITVAVNPGASDPGYSAVPPQTVAVTTQDDDTTTDAAIASAFEAQTYNFMAHRANMITTHEPELFRLINRRDGAAGSGNNGFNVDVEGGNAKGDFALSASALQRILSGENITATPTADVPRSTGSMDAWIEGQFAYYKDKTDALADHGNFLIGYAGVDYKAADNLLLGVMAEVDWMAEHQDNGKVKGTGWMVGPYLTTEPADDVFFDLRAMWGKSNNSAVQSLLGANMGGDFDTSRWLVEAKLAGIYHAGDFDVTPDIRLIYMRENQDDFMVSGGGRNVAVNGQTVSLGQMSTGLKLSRSFMSDGTTIEPYVSGHLIWNFENPELRDVAGGTVKTSDLQGEAALGLTIASDTTQLSAEASYDGLFSHDLSAVSAKLMFAHQF